MEKNAEQRLTDKKNKALFTFGWSFSAGMAMLTAVGVWKGFPQWAIILSSTLCVLHLVFFLVWRKGLLPLFLLTGFIGHVLGFLIATIIFGVVYYLLFTPISFVLRLAGKDVIHTHSAAPHWIDIPESANNPKRIEKLY